MFIIYIAIYIYIYIYIYLYIYIPSDYVLWQLMRLRMHSRTSFVQVHELPESNCGGNREETLSSYLHIYYRLLASVRFEQSMCCGSLIVTYL